jgi:hypothetical protein
VISWLVCLAVAQAAATDLTTIGQVTDPGLRELSGLVRDSRDSKLFWAHGDSGNAAALFAIDSSGRVLCRVDIAAPNLDWEDIATDHRGRLYIGDIGNNGSFLPRRFIYEIEEPRNHGAGGPSRPLKPSGVYTVAFPDRPFDAEGLVLLGEQLVVVRKRLDGRAATLHAIPLESHGSLLEPVRWREIATLNGFTEPATGADVSPDERWLAVCSNTVTRVYEYIESGWRLESSLRYPPRSIEAVAWDGDDLVLGDEGGRLFRWSRPTKAASDRRAAE